MMEAVRAEPLGEHEMKEQGDHDLAHLPGADALNRRVGFLELLFLGFWCAIVLAFGNSAFRIDEPNMLALARQIAAEPLDPYGFEINWLGTSEPAFKILSNPPMLPYWLAGWASIFGWTEMSIRLAMLPFGLMLLYAGMRLAALFDAPPLWVAGAALASPVFVLSGILAMPDMPAAALGTLAVVAAIRYGRHGGWGVLVIGMLAAGAAPLFKYNAITLVAPLAVLTAISAERRWGRLLLAASPAVGLILWSAISAHWYGEPHMVASARFQSDGSNPNIVAFLLPMIGLAVIPFPLLTSGSSRRRGLRIALVGGAAIAGSLGGWLLEYPVYAVLLIGLGTALGAHAIVVAAESALSGRHDGWERMALGAWIAANLLLQFRLLLLATRYLLPIVIPIAVLLWTGRRRPSGLRTVALIIAGAFALALASGDARQGNLYREAVRELPADVDLLFDGHWGLQHYAEKRGGRSVEGDETTILDQGQLLIRASHAAPSGARLLAADHLEIEAWEKTVPLDWPIRSIDCSGANFHANALTGCDDVLSTHLPFGISTGPAERLFFFRAVPSREPAP